MASNGNFFKSVRFKFLLWYIAALTVTLLCFSAVLYGSFSKILYGDLDDLLSSKADGIANAIDAYWDADRVIKIGQAEGQAGFKNIAQEWLEEKRKDHELMNIFAQILDTGSSVIVSSKNMPRLEALRHDDLKDVLSGEDSFDTLDGNSFDGKKLKFRVYTRAVSEDGLVKYMVQVAGPVTLVSLALNNLILILFVLLPLTVLLAGIPGVLLARLTLRPVDRMIDTLRQITAENLKLKIHIPDTKDEIKRLADTFNDMIERLDRSFTSQQRFIQDLFYALKTPMIALKDELEGSSAKKLSVEEHKELIIKASKELEAFSQITENLLILSRFDDNRVTLEIRKIDICHLISDVLGRMKNIAEEKDIDVAFTCSGGITLDGDDAQLRRVFMNLFDNAVKYTYRKGKISVTVRDGEGSVKIYFNDTGIGIPEDEQTYIFDRFYQAGGSRGINRGFGLGLSSAMSIVEAHKGDIAVESQPGKGTTFIVTLPISYPG
jgi:signal transduction histidine kinase